MLLYVLIIVITCMFCTNAKLCQDVSVRNEISSFEKNLRGCSVIHGNLEVALIEDETTDDFSGVSFPELIEIRGFFLLYRVYGLTTLSTLFPNLTIIRGLNLFREYSLILFDLTDLKEIGLPKLKYILNGSTRIEMCPQICYIDKVKWTSVGHPSHKVDHFNINKEECGTCPDNCKGLCWGKYYCQETALNDCHPECLGCTEPNSSDKCIECRNFKNNGTCINKCPEGKFRHLMLVACLSESECINNPLRGTWWTFRGECIRRCPQQHTKIQRNGRLDCEFCGDDCRKVCDGIEIDSKNLSDELYGCTHIIGSLSIKTESKMRTNELYSNLEMVEEIDGYLKIHRSTPLTSLQFLKKLRVIHGNELHKNKYSFIAFENQNLHSLWTGDHTVTLNKGTLFLHDNSKLCLSKIKQFAEVSNLTYTEFDVSPHSNGNHRTCNYIKLNVTVVNLNATNVTLVWENATATRNISGPFAYWLSYTEDLYGNISAFHQDEECFQNIWMNALVTENSTLQILHLKPFTQYAYYIRLYTNLSDHEGQTRIRYFTTLSDNPSELVNFNAVSTTSDSVTLNWELPLTPNGRLGRYELVVYYEQDDETFIAQRNFCKHPHYGYISTVMNVTVKPCCQKQEYASSSDEFEFTCDRLNLILNEDVTPGGCNNYMYSLEEKTDPNELSIHSNAEFVPEMLVSAHRIVKRSFSPMNFSETIEMKIEDTRMTSYIVKPLQHFSMYIFLLKVCHKWTKSQCSSPVMTFQRTVPKADADNIPPGLSIRFKSSKVIISWFEPREPNSLIVSYQIEHQRSDIDNSNPSTECITRNEFVESNHEFQIKNLLPGQYIVRVKAISLAGPGKFSHYTNFVVPAPTPSFIHSLIGLICVAVGVVLLTIAIFIYYRDCYRNRHNMEQDILLQNLCPWINSEDDWEMDRSDVELINVLTRGSRITTYNGRIVSQNRQCVIKSTTEISIHNTATFLNQVNTMKMLSNANHVVRLLGIVSKGNPPLALMEIADRGDLKTYLRQLQAAAINTTSNELYRMAAQIADGMCYFSSQRFVHRDLAARTCMVFADYTVKVGDYGVSKDLYREDYQRTEDGNLIPVRWMAPENLTLKTFSTDSDVWSYGVLLWELVTFAKQPYEGVPNQAISDFITNQGILERPDECPELLYDIMKACWRWVPSDRPQFFDILERFDGRIGQQFSLVSFYHSREGERYRRTGRIRVYNQPSPLRPPSGNFGIHWHSLQDEHEN